MKSLAFRRHWNSSATTDLGIQNSQGVLSIHPQDTPKWVLAFISCREFLFDVSTANHQQTNLWRNVLQSINSKQSSPKTPVIWWRMIRSSTNHQPSSTLINLHQTSPTSIITIITHGHHRPSSPIIITSRSHHQPPSPAEVTIDTHCAWSQRWAIRPLRRQHRKSPPELQHKRWSWLLFLFVFVVLFCFCCFVVFWFWNLYKTRCLKTKVCL